MIPLLRLANDPRSPTALPGMLTRSGEIAKPPFRILLAEWSTDWLLRQSRLPRTLRNTRLRFCFNFLRHGISLCVVHSDLGHQLRQLPRNSFASPVPTPRSPANVVKTGRSQSDLQANERKTA